MMNEREYVPVFRNLVEARLTEDGRQWLEQCCASIIAGNDSDSLTSAFTMAGRKLGKAAVVLKPHDRVLLDSLGITWAPVSRTDEWARGIFLLLGYAAGRPDMPAVVESCFVTGDLDERRAVLRSLPLLPDAAGFVSLAAEACRSNIEPLFTAMSCGNPYPARYFSDQLFHCMVLKALYLGIPVKRIIGLEQRRGPELTRMALDLARERRAAGRPIPFDLDHILAPATTTVGKPELR